jgi:hypothetical protein
MAESVEQLWAQLCAESQGFYERVRPPVAAFAAELAQLPADDPRVVAWLQERLWSEREGAKTKAYAVVRLAEVLDADTVVALAHQSMGEAVHYRYLEPCLLARGGTLAAYEPAPRWQRIFQKEYEFADTRDPIVFFAGVHLGGEGPASATAEIYAHTFANSPHADVARAYQKIAVEEAGHWSTGRTVLRGYLKTPADAQRALAALRAMGEVLFGEYRHRAET